MPLYLNTFFETRVQQLFDLAHRVNEAFSAAGIDYRVVGGLATYLYVEEAAADAGRLTRDVDVIVRREDLARIEAAVAPYGLKYRHAAELHMLLQTEDPSPRRAVHLLFTGEKVRPEYCEPAPDLGEGRTLGGVRVVPLEDLVRMKLTSFRAKDEAHIDDLDEAGLITGEIEATLSPVLLERLRQARVRG